MSGMVVDLFAGGGGASVGIEAALGRPVDLAVNHSACPSIFERSRPLAEKTLWRIAQGIRRFVLENPRPFIVKVNHGGSGARVEPINRPVSTVTATQRGHALVAPTLMQTGYGEREGQAARNLDLFEPLGTVVAGGQKHALVGAFLAKHFGDAGQRPGSEMVEPVSTITASDHNALVTAARVEPGQRHGRGDASAESPLSTVMAKDRHALAAVALAKFRGTHESQPASLPVTEPLPTTSAGGIHVAEVRAFLTAYYGEDATSGQSLFDPARTITAKHRLGLVTVEGTEYQIVDIGMRMLEPHELLRAQFGRFAETYDLTAARTKSAKVRLIGNSVCPEVAEALVRANVPSALEMEGAA